LLGLNDGFHERAWAGCAVGLPELGSSAMVPGDVGSSYRGEGIVMFLEVALGRGVCKVLFTERMYFYVIKMENSCVIISS
jgi:hypothetical protein